MDLGIFVVWVGLGFSFVGSLIAAIVLLWSRKQKRKARAVFVIGFAPFLIWSLHVYKVIYLNEGLLQAACQGDKPGVIRLLKLGADPEAQPETFTPLTCAQSNGHTEIVKLLVQAGAKQ
jgi:hypothetical protein